MKIKLAASLLIVASICGCASVHPSSITKMLEISPSLEKVTVTHRRADVCFVIVRNGVRPIEIDGQRFSQRQMDHLANGVVIAQAEETNGINMRMGPTLAEQQVGMETDPTVTELVFGLLEEHLLYEAQVVPCADVL